MVFDLAYIGYFHASLTQIYNDTVNLTFTANLAGRQSVGVPASLYHNMQTLSVNSIGKFTLRYHVNM